MSPIKILLLIPLFAMVVLFVLQLRNQTFYRITFIVMMVIGIVFVLDPELTNTIAHKLNVGRGADLLLYFFVIAGFCAMLVFYSKLRGIESTQTEIIRQSALASVKKEALQ